MTNTLLTRENLITALERALGSPLQCPSEIIFDLINHYDEDMAALRSIPESGREAIVGGTNFCGHSMMAALCDKCNPWLRVKNEDPPLRWLLQELRRIAKEGAANEPLMKSPRDHICHLAADLIEHTSTNATFRQPASEMAEARKCFKCSKDPTLPEACNNVECPYVYS